MKVTLLIKLAMIGMSANIAFADDISLGDPAYGGSGCPAGTASAVLSPDAKELSILFDQYEVDAGRTAGTVMARKSCAVAIPVHVPQGMSVSLVSIDYRGYNSLPAGASTDFTVDYFFAGSQGPSYAKHFAGPLDSDYLLNNTLAVGGIVWSACGQDVILRTNTSIRTRSNFRGDQTMATVDSADIKAGLLYHLQWRSCY